MIRLREICKRKHLCLLYEWDQDRISLALLEIIVNDHFFDSSFVEIARGTADTEEEAIEELLKDYDDTTRHRAPA